MQLSAVNAHRGVEVRKSKMLPSAEPVQWFETAFPGSDLVAIRIVAMLQARRDIPTESKE